MKKSKEKDKKSKEKTKNKSPSPNMDSRIKKEYNKLIKVFVSFFFVGFVRRYGEKY